MVRKICLAALFGILRFPTAGHCLPDPGSASLPHVDRVLVYKSKRLMELCNGSTVLRSYRVALGRNPVGRKVRAGDCRTPEGSYRLDRRSAASRFYRSIHISYPNAADRAAAQKLGVSPGGDIMIHGLPKGFEDVGEFHAITDWTKGCIAVTNAEISEIWRLVPDGTPIEIRP
ncbi:L,D-transpeptidase family protein [Geobacter sp.]|uniref:L,D-transpeptidase family protein n=1 Tax=Geobacter sp. TaxID=46610 RepID=UPI00260ABDB1|nr:L,D-transpeptidase family protein [Geobacter sp.]